jgi:hypothetical protein
MNELMGDEWVVDGGWVMVVGEWVVMGDEWWWVMRW